MKKATIFLGIVLISFLIPGLAVSGHHYGGYHCGMPSWDKDSLDVDRDGELTFDEFTAPQAKKWRAGFDMIDVNGDGVISDMEWEEFLSAHGKNKK